MALFYWLKTLTDEGRDGGWEGGGGALHPEKTPDDELQNMPHTEARKFQPQARLEPALYNWWQARKTDMVTITPRVTPDITEP